MTDAARPRPGNATGPSTGPAPAARLRVHALAAAGLLLVGTAAPHVLSTGRPLADELGEFDIERVIPKAFGAWRTDPLSQVGVIDPQLAAALDRIYTHIVSRTYVGDDGYRIMVSAAYGPDQRGDLQAHRPEVCYPAQGFEVLANRIGRIPYEDGVLPVRQLQTVLNRSRYEPVSYWIMVGSQSVVTMTEKRLADIRYSLKGRIPDGLLFRVSSIDRDAEQGFVRQSAFVRELLATLDPVSRRRMAGSPQPAA